MRRRNLRGSAQPRLEASRAHYKWLRREDPLPLTRRATGCFQDQPITLENHRASFSAAIHGWSEMEFDVVDDLAIAYLKRATVGAEA